MDRLPCDVSKMTPASTPSSVPNLFAISVGGGGTAAAVASLVPVLHDGRRRVDERSVQVEEEPGERVNFGRAVSSHGERSTASSRIWKGRWKDEWWEGRYLCSIP